MMEVVVDRNRNIGPDLSVLRQAWLCIDKKPLLPLMLGTLFIRNPFRENYSLLLIRGIREQQAFRS